MASKDGSGKNISSGPQPPASSEYGGYGGLTNRSARGASIDPQVEPSDQQPSPDWGDQDGYAGSDSAENAPTTPGLPPAKPPASSKP